MKMLHMGRKYPGIDIRRRVTALTKAVIDENIRLTGVGRECRQEESTEGEKQNSLARARLESANMDQLFDAFQHNAPIPSKDEFVQRLKEKVEGEGPSRLRLRLDAE